MLIPNGFTFSGVLFFDAENHWQRKANSKYPNEKQA